MRLILTGLILAGAIGWSHHAASADFDVTRLIVLQGTVKDVEWINPHAWLHLNVKDAGGKVTVWQIEGASGSVYELRKFPKEALTPGVEITITAYPAKNGDTMADGATITFKDRKRVFFGGSAPADGLDKDGKPCIYKLNSPCQKDATF